MPWNHRKGNDAAAPGSINSKYREMRLDSFPRIVSEKLTARSCQASIAMRNLFICQLF
jgi:hypothetical protein